MSNNPDNTKWYLADLIVEIKVENDPRNVVHINTLLVCANSPEEAYNKAIDFGNEENNTYENSDGNQVEFKFRGLKNLSAIHDDLEHGAELFFEEQFELPENKIQGMIRSKEKLGVFAPRIKEDKPNYLAKDIYEDMLNAGFSKEDLE